MSKVEDMLIWELEDETNVSTFLDIWQSNLSNCLKFEDHLQSVALWEKIQEDKRKKMQEGTQ
jgi:hypothetical protein